MKDHSWGELDSLFAFGPTGRLVEEIASVLHGNFVILLRKVDAVALFGDFLVNPHGVEVLLVRRKNGVEMARQWRGIFCPS